MADPAEGPHDPPAPRPGPLSWQRRAARLGWAAVGLAALCVGFLALAVWLLATNRPPVSEAAPRRVAVLPVDVVIGVPRVSVVLAVAAGVAALVVGTFALQAAGAMRVLSRGRGLAHPVPGRAATLSRTVLGPAAVRALELDRPPDWPVTAVPAAADVPGTTLRCTVLVPARNEEAVIGRTITSLRHQSRPAHRILVLADNSTDGTVRVAREHGADVVETVGNTQAKAGALNQVLARLLLDADVEDVFLVMDADSTISEHFLAAALGMLEADPDLMAVGGLFSGEEGFGLLGQLQRNEFLRYQRVIGRREGRLFVLTGTASVIRAYALRAVAEARGVLVPGVSGDVYDTLAMTEDNELTLALKSLGAGVVSPPECRVTTEVMPTWSALRRQRLRWQRGAIENVGAYGFTRTTALYWAQQLALVYGVVALNSYLLLFTISLLAADQLAWSPLWVAITGLFVVERVVTAWAAGWRGRAVALPLVVELVYSLFLQLTFVASLVQIARRREAGWNYVRREVVAGAVVPALGAGALLARWTPLPSSVLESSFVEALSLFVGINTLVYATLCLFQLLPPIRRTVHRARARRAAAA